jgi:hypothetical protein
MPPIAGPAQQTQQAQFDLIVRVMRHGDHRSADLRGHASQEPVPQFAGGHFEGNPFPPRLRPHVSSPDPAVQTQCPRSRPDESFIRIRGPAPELVIEMRHHEAPLVLFRQHRQQMEEEH